MLDLLAYLHVFVPPFVHQIVWLASPACGIYDVRLVLNDVLSSCNTGFWRVNDLWFGWPSLAIQCMSCSGLAERVAHCSGWDRKHVPSSNRCFLPTGCGTGTPNLLPCRTGYRFQSPALTLVCEYASQYASPLWRMCTCGWVWVVGSKFS